MIAHFQSNTRLSAVFWENGLSNFNEGMKINLGAKYLGIFSSCFLKKREKVLLLLSLNDKIEK
jgi:hypothetical protein